MTNSRSCRISVHEGPPPFCLPALLRLLRDTGTILIHPSTPPTLYAKVITSNRLPPLPAPRVRRVPFPFYISLVAIAAEGHRGHSYIVEEVPAEPSVISLAEGLSFADAEFRRKEQHHTSYHNVADPAVNINRSW